MSAAAHPSKRQRTTAPLPGGGPSPPLRLDDLPAGALAAVSEFLPQPSQALFAVAVTAPPSSWLERCEDNKPILPSPACQAILSLTPKAEEVACCPAARCCRVIKEDKWKALDFKDLEAGLAGRLTDDHLASILICVDAARRTTTLKLTGLVGLTGSGLRPVSRSTVLRQLDLSLVGRHDSPLLTPAPRIEESAVLPLLASLVALEGTSLRQLTLPRKFRAAAPSAAVEDLVFAYDALLEAAGGACPRCREEEACWGNENSGGVPWFVDDEESRFYGCQNFTCYDCMGNFCLGGCVGLCMDCERASCMDCDPVLQCTGCKVEKCRTCWAKNDCGCRAGAPVEEQAEGAEAEAEAEENGN